MLGTTINQLARDLSQLEWTPPGLANYKNRALVVSFLSRAQWLTNPLEVALLLELQASTWEVATTQLCLMPRLPQLFPSPQTVKVHTLWLPSVSVKSKLMGLVFQPMVTGNHSAIQILELMPFSPPTLLVLVSHPTSGIKWPTCSTRSISILTKTSFVTTILVVCALFKALAAHGQVCGIPDGLLRSNSKAPPTISFYHWPLLPKMTQIMEFATSTSNSLMMEETLNQTKSSLEVCIFKCSRTTYLTTWPHMKQLTTSNCQARTAWTTPTLAMLCQLHLRTHSLPCTILLPKSSSTLTTTSIRLLLAVNLLSKAMFNSKYLFSANKSKLSKLTVWAREAEPNSVAARMLQSSARTTLTPLSSTASWTLHHMKVPTVDSTLLATSTVLVFVLLPKTSNTSAQLARVISTQLTLSTTTTGTIIHLLPPVLLVSVKTPPCGTSSVTLPSKSTISIWLTTTIGLGLIQIGLPTQPNPSWTSVISLLITTGRLNLFPSPQRLVDPTCLRWAHSVLVSITQQTAQSITRVFWTLTQIWLFTELSRILLNLPSTLGVLAFQLNRSTSLPTYFLLSATVNLLV